MSVGTIDIGQGFRVVVSGRPRTPFALAVSLYPGSIHTRYGTLCLNPRRTFVIQDAIFRRNDPPLDDTGHYDRSFSVMDDPMLLGRHPTFQAIIVDPNAPHGLSLSRSETRVVGNGSRGDFRGAVIGFHPGERVSFGGALGDVDSDGDVDLIINKDSGMTLLLNDGTGSFADGTHGSTTGIPAGASRFGAVKLVDVDLDGDLDLICESSVNLDLRLRLLINDGQGLFVDGSDGTTTGTPPACCSGSATDLLVGDLDGDGAPDLILSGYAAIYLNDGHGAFRDATHGPGSGWSPGYGIGQTGVVGDFDGDGDLDVVFSSPSFNPSLFLNDGSAFFTDGTNGPGTGLPPASEVFTELLAGDLDRDGDLDLVMNSLSGQTRTWMNQGGGFFVDETFGAPNGGPPRLPLRYTYTFGSVLVDVDRDGDLDFYLSNWLDGRALLYLNDGSGTFSDSFGSSQTGASLAWSIGNRAVAADFDGDGDPTSSPTATATSAKASSRCPF
ncbi:MAG: VCBS repeat-containing protein [Planctomycetes bacterium]|nr:VCBS repeat-containing protein [Planctomycetota bacterium]MBI3844335.1 VCBS repeat-containing protein [Planctomycetota bacterium]